MLLTIFLPAFSSATSMNMAVAWFNVNEEPGTCTVEEGAVISALMVPAINSVLKTLSVIGGGRAWEEGHEENRRSMLASTENEESIESEEAEERELCANCKNACAYNFYECKYVYNCCPCGYCRRLSLLGPILGVSATVVASSLEITCEGVLLGITSLQLQADLSSSCMTSLKSSVCKADVSLAK